MAEALASVVIELLATALIEKMEQVVKLAVEAKDEMRKLQVTFGNLQYALKILEQKEFIEDGLKHWLEQFKDVAYDMEDVLDEWRTEVLRSQIEGTPPDKNDDRYKHMMMNKQKQQVSSYYCCSPFSTCFKKAVLYYDIGSRINEITKTLDAIYTEKARFDCLLSGHEFTTAANGNDVIADRQTSSVPDSNTYGRDSDKNNILDRLLGREGSSSSSSNSDQLGNKTYNIISIVGMGGLGKTTLAQLIIKDDEVKARFDKTIWVCVSEPFDRTRIAKAIIHEAGETAPTSPEWEALHNKLCDSVKGKTFLLVLDDVWTNKEKDLKPIKDLLLHGANGSRIIVTTRKQSIAKMMNSYEYHLGILSDDDSWLLLSHKAFSGFEREENNELNEIGFQIAKKCNGLPLAATVLGSLLGREKTEEHWRRVWQSEIWELDREVEHELFKPLLLSYNALESQLKRCFTYCAVFPKDHRIKKHTLIKMWMAQGFINSTATGEKYFKSLSELSFFQAFSKDDDGIIIGCKVHDIVHDFAQFLTNDQIYVKDNNEKPFNYRNNKVHHLTLSYIEDGVKPSSFHTSMLEANKNIRSLLVSGPNSINLTPRHALSNLFHNLRGLRVLQLNRMDIAHLPHEIKELIHLRYLDLSNNASLNDLPDSVCSLYNLQTLKLKRCRGLRRLPKEMWKMINLKHLDLRGINHLSLPEGIGKLTSLETLNEFIIGGARGGCKISELKDLNLLQGRMDIRGLGSLKTVTEASEAELKAKQGLYRLVLDFTTADVERRTNSCVGDDENLDASAVETLESIFGELQPHPNLVNLKVLGYQGWKLPSWIASLSRLRILNISDCVNCTELPALGLLPSLEYLDLINLKSLKRIGVEIYGHGSGICIKKVAFRKLRKLNIRSDNLEIWNIGDGEVGGEIMPCVTSVILVSEKLKVLPALWKLPSLETLHIEGSIDEVTHIGAPEIYGIGSTIVGGGSFNLTAFPNLKSLMLKGLTEMEELDLGADIRGNIGDQVILMPRLDNMSIYSCSKLRTLKGLSRLQSVEVLELHGLNNLEEFNTGEDSIIMPCIQGLKIILCENLKSLQQLHLPKLNELVIWACPTLVQLPTSPNLVSLEMWNTSHSSSPPQGLSGFKKLQYLFIWDCPFMTSIPEDVRHLTALQTLKIEECPWPQNPECIDQEEEAWSFMSHIPEIIIDGELHVRADQPNHAARSSTLLRQDQ